MGSLFDSNALQCRFDQYRERVAQTALVNHRKVLEAFGEVSVTTDSFIGSTGYGYQDFGRKKLNELYSHVFRAEDALVSTRFASGTHTIYTALRSLLNPGDRLVSLTGTLYDTLEKSLLEPEGLVQRFGIQYETIALKPTGIDEDYIRSGALFGAKVAFIQRSRGYSQRNAISIDEIQMVASLIKTHAPKTILFVDNCYGEFVEDREPIEVGADIIAGSLIKNPGGTIALSGGYLCGRANWIDLVAQSFTVPGIGREIGNEDSESLRLSFQGLSLAPKMVEEALLSAYYAGLVLNDAGFHISPGLDEKRSDIIQSIAFGEPNRLLTFIRGIQGNSLVDSHALPEPWDMPGYDHPIVMASGSFIGGSSSELSADAPMREPYVAYLQGSSSLYYSKLAIDAALKGVLELMDKEGTSR